MALEAGQIEEFRERFEGLSTDPDLQANVDERDLQRLREDDKYVLCFVHWKKGNIEEATKLAAQVLTWRKERRVNDLRAEDIGEPLMKRGIMFVHGRALDDTRVVYFISRLQTKEIKTQVQAIMCLWMERLQRLETGKHVTFLLDVSKASMANVDLGGIKFLLECFTTYFPDMLERIIILEMPWIMNAIWKVVKQWMTEEQRRRTIFCKFKELKEYISQDQLPQYMGGADTWEYIFPLRPTDYPQLKETTQTAQSSTNSMESLHENDEVSNNEEDKMMPPSDKVSSTRDKIFTTSDEASTSHLRATPNIQSPQDEESLPNGRLATEQELDRVPSNSILTSSTTNSSKASLDQSESKRRNTPSRHSSFTSEIDREESYKSFTGFDGSMNMQQNSKASARDVTSEVRLGSLLFMSPISELSFREDRRDGGSGRCQSIVTLRNPNQDQLVAFKFKTNSPERYHVRPSNGVVTPGETTTVVINLSPGYEESASSDRFLVLYQKIDAAADVHEFWSQHTAKDSRFVHRLRVRFIRSTKVEKIATPVLKKPMLPPVTKKAPFTSTEVTQMTREISLLKTKLAQAEVNTRWLRTKFQYSMILQIILTLLLLFALHQLSSLASLVELGQLQATPRCHSYDDHTGGSPDA
ncbi:unnamed protein product [Clavelina lepadiformis]|uniref:Motile sperm domain-containing protein 2 n=1 Tax=Clavelina lepadiformis TaxID=159417 RepID=A0ABP0G305_CLALP